MEKDKPKEESGITKILRSFSAEEIGKVAALKDSSLMKVHARCMEVDERELTTQAIHASDTSNVMNFYGVMKELKGKRLGYNLLNTIIKKANELNGRKAKGEIKNGNIKEGGPGVK